MKALYILLVSVILTQPKVSLVNDQLAVSDQLTLSDSLEAEIKQGHVRILTKGWQPSFSPDRKTIAYVLDGKIWLIEIESGIRKRVGRFHNENFPSWSPDGKKIIFQCYGEEQEKNDAFEIWVMNSDGTNPEALVRRTPDDSYGNQMPRYSPNGKYIVWVRDSRLWIMESDGGNARPLTSERAEVYALVGDWSPDSKVIAYIRRDDAYDPFGQIWTVRPNGEDERIFGKVVKVDYVKWSKDGRFLYFSVVSSLWKISVHGDMPVCEVFDSHVEQGLGPFDISSDDRWLAFSNPDTELIYLKRLDK